MDKIHMTGPWMTDIELDFVTDAIKNCGYDNPYKYCELFQSEFAANLKRKYALMTPSCTHALHLLLMGLGIAEGDEVLVPECTWIGTAAPVSYVRATPVFCDIDPDDWCISPESIRKNFTSKTKAVIVVGLYGNMPKMDKIEELCRELNIFLIEDAAETLGSTYKGKKSGSFGEGAVFSFHRTKTLAVGAGGMLVLDDTELFEKCSKLRDSGRGENTPTYFNEIIGYNYMASNVLAALGLAQHQRLEKLVSKKREILKMYMERLSDVRGLQFNVDNRDIFNSAWMTTFVYDREYNIKKNDAIEMIKKKGCPVRPFFYPLTSIPAYSEEFNDQNMKELNPVAYDISQRGLNLPSALNLTEKNIDRVCQAIKTVFFIKTVSLSRLAQFPSARGKR